MAISDLSTDELVGIHDGLHLLAANGPVTEPMTKAHDIVEAELHSDLRKASPHTFKAAKDDPDTCALCGKDADDSLHEEDDDEEEETSAATSAKPGAKPFAPAKGKGKKAPPFGKALTSTDTAATAEVLIEHPGFLKRVARNMVEFLKSDPDLYEDPDLYDAYDDGELTDGQLTDDAYGRN